VKSGPEIPPWVAIVVIVVVVAVAGAFIWRGTGKKSMSTDQQAKMREMMKERGFTLKGQEGSAPGARPGATTQWATPQQSGPR
jgi:flagellar basal body-associated protein FliL